MAIDRTGISSLDAGASDITYSGNQGPKSPDQQLMASADPMLVEEYNKYVFEMEEQGLQPMSFRQFMEQAMSGMAEGGRAGYQSGKSVKPLGISDEEWEKMLGLKGPRPLSSQSPYLSVHADGGRAGFQRGGGPDWINTHDPGPMGNPAVMEEIEDMREFRIANPDIEDVADYEGYYERLRRKRLQEMMGRRSGAYGGTAKPTYTQSRKQNLAYGGIAGVDGRKRYGVGSWFQDVKDKFIDDIIPNEIKDNPMLTAAITGGLLNQYGLPDLIPGDMSTKGVGQNWLG